MNKEHTFLGIPYRRIGESSRLWFTAHDIGTKLGIGGKALNNKMKVSAAAPFRVLMTDIADLRVHLTGRTPLADLMEQGETVHPLFEVDYLIAAAFSLPTEGARVVRDFVQRQIADLVYDGFVSLPFERTERGELIYRAIAAWVCCAENYYQIAVDRFDGSDEARGTVFAPNKLTEERLLAPESYMTRHNITQIRAIELSLRLLEQHVEGVIAENMLLSLGISLDLAGDKAAQERAAAWLKDAHKTATIRRI